MLCLELFNELRFGCDIKLECVMVQYTATIHRWGEERKTPFVLCHAWIHLKMSAWAKRGMGLLLKGVGRLKEGTMMTHDDTWQKSRDLLYHSALRHCPRPVHSTNYLLTFVSHFPLGSFFPLSFPWALLPSFLIVCHVFSVTFRHLTGDLLETML